MCGLVGIAGNLSLPDEKTMKSLLLFDYFRGMDSTGMSSVAVDGSFKTAKLASHPLDLFDSKRFSEALNAYKSVAFIGHNRAATKGAVNNLNAHPYESGEVVGVHNGTLTTASWDALKKAIGENTGTDSQAVIIAIDKLGIEETVKLMEGAWALVWYDGRTHTMNFLRNDERPLWYSYTDDFEKLIWASEHWMIRAAVTNAPNNTYKMFVDEEGFGYWQFEKDHHYCFDIDSLVKGVNRPKPLVKKIEGRGTPVYTAGSNFPSHSYTGGKTTTTTSTTTYPSTSPASSIAHIECTPDKPFGDVVTKEEFAEMSKSGCAFCFEEVDIHDQGIIILTAGEQVLCKDCSGHGVTRIYTDPTRLAKAA